MDGRAENFSQAVKAAMAAIAARKEGIPPETGMWRWQAAQEAGFGDLVAWIDDLVERGVPGASRGDPSVMKRFELNRVRSARIGPIQHWQLRGEIAARIQAGRALPASYRDFAIEILNGNVEPPLAPKARPEKALFARNRVLYLSVKELCEDFGLRPYRNDISPHLSACDAVAEAWKKARNERMSYSTVRNAYREKPGAKTDAYLFRALTGKNISET